MPNTVKITSNKGSLSFAGLQVQPLPFEDDQSILTSDVYTQGADGYEASQTANTADLIDAVGVGAIVPPVVGSKSGKVVASYGAGYSEAQSSHTNLVKSGNRLLRPIEQLTGMTSDRPEIVMITKFQPAYSDSKSSTETVKTVVERANHVGRFISGQHAARSIRRAVASRVVSTALTRSSVVRADLTNRQSTIKTELQALNAAAAFMLNVVQSSLAVRSGLDLRDVSNTVDPQKIAKTHGAETHTDVGPGTAYHGKLPTLNVAARYNVVDVMTRLGYDSNTTRATFTSTKLWLQLVSDMRSALKYHSLDLVDASTDVRKKDRSPTALTRIDAKYFALKSKNTKQLPSLSDIRATSKGDLLAFSSNVAVAYTSMYDGPHIKSEEMRLSLLVNLLAKELRYSRGLSHELVKKTLKDSYSYAVNYNKENIDVIDAVLGVPGTSISHVSSDNSHTLVGLAQHQTTNRETVLTFESDYIDTQDGVCVPGSAYYIDDVLNLNDGKFDTTRLKEFRQRCSTAFVDFSRFETGLDLMGTGYSLDNTNSTTGKMAAIVADPRKLFRHIADKFVDTSTGYAQIDVSTDPLSAVYAEARSDVKLKALLFLLTLARLSRAAPDNLSFWDIVGQKSVDADPTFTTLLTNSHAAANTLADAIIDLMIKKLSKANVASSGASSTNIKVTVDSMRDALVKGTKLTNAIDSTFASVFDTFVSDGRAMTTSTTTLSTTSVTDIVSPSILGDAAATKIVSSKTLYSGYGDTMIAMVIFDLLCAVISRYSGMKTVGLITLASSSSAAQECAVVSYTATTHAKSFAEIAGRLEKECTLVTQAVAVMSTAAQNIASSVSAFSDYLSSPDSAKQLSKIVSVIGVGSELKALFTEQQIMLVAAAVDDMIEISQRTNEDLDSSGSTDSKEEIRFLDDEDASPGAVAILNAALATSELTSTKGSNKRIIAVGVPIGLGEHLKRKVDLTTVKPGAFRTQRANIIKIMLHKVDIQLPDVVFHPRPYFFELNRFTVKNSARYLQAVPGCTFDDIVVAVPTRVYGSAAGTKLVYADPKDLLNAKVHNAKIVSDRVALGDSEHAFLPSTVRAEILRNHVISHLMESYIRILTGINLSEYHFGLELPTPLVSGDVLAHLIDARIAHVSDSFNIRNDASDTSSASGLFGHLVHESNSTITREQAAIAHPRSDDSQGPARPNVRAMRPDAQNVIKHDARTVSCLSRQLTILSDPLRVSRQFLMPKQFDRVFHLVVDPDDFEIDVEATSATLHGQQSLAALQANYDVVAVPMSSAETQEHAQKTSHERLRLKPRDHGAGDMSFEKYIVTIEPSHEGM